MGWTPERGVEHQVGWQGDQASVFGGMFMEDAYSKVEVQHRIQAGGNAWG